VNLVQNEVRESGHEVCTGFYPTVILWVTFQGENTLHVTQSKHQKPILENRSAFTLLELLIVLIILGIFAMIAIPQITDSTKDAELNTLATNLRIMQSNIELYHYQHNSTYPGHKTTDGSSTDNVDASEAAKGFVDQLSLYTSANGETKNTRDTIFIYGPYLKSGMPVNPYNDKSDVVCDITTADPNVRASDGKSGWKFYTKTGVFIANDGAHDEL